MTLRAPLLALASIAIGSAGCSESEGEEGCLAMAEAMAASASECGVSRGDAFEAFVDELDECDFDSLRDKPSFDGVCIPALRGLSCATLSQPVVELPPECKDQLVRDD